MIRSLGGFRSIWSLCFLGFGLFVIGSAGADKGTHGSKTTDLKIALFRAISLADQAEAVRIVEAGVDPNVREDTGNQLTALHRAAEHGLEDVVRVLVTKGANLDATAPFFRGTPLVVALGNGHEGVARFLIVSGANAAAIDSAGYTPLHVAAGSTSTQMVKLLLAKRVNVNARSDIGRTPLYGAIASERWDNARLLIAHGADIHGDIGEGTALIMAARRGNQDFAGLLVTKGADVRAKNAVGLTALHYAALNGHVDVVELLIGKGADVNTAGASEGKSVDPPIVGAAYKGHLNVVKSLATHGADLKFKGDRGNPVSWAAFGGHYEIVEWLVNHGAEVNPYPDEVKVEQGLQLPLYAAVYSATFSNDLRTIRFLIAKGANVNAMARNGESALSYAKKHGLQPIVDLLLANGAKK